MRRGAIRPLSSAHAENLVFRRYLPGKHPKPVPYTLTSPSQILIDLKPIFNLYREGHPKIKRHVSKYYEEPVIRALVSYVGLQKLIEELTNTNPNRPGSHVSAVWDMLETEALEYVHEVLRNDESINLMDRFLADLYQDLDAYLSERLARHNLPYPYFEYEVIGWQSETLAILGLRHNQT